MSNTPPMPRIPPDDAVPLPLELEEVSGSSGIANMSILFRIMAHRPNLMQHSAQLLEAAMRTGTVEPQLKELVAVRVSQVNHCSY